LLSKIAEHWWQLISFMGAAALTAYVGLLVGTNYQDQRVVVDKCEETNARLKRTVVSLEERLKCLLPGKVVFGSALTTLSNGEAAPIVWGGANPTILTPPNLTLTKVCLTHPESLIVRWGARQREGPVIDTKERCTEFCPEGIPIPANDRIWCLCTAANCEDGPVGCTLTGFVP
jgi:hypothetical protein